MEEVSDMVGFANRQSFYASFFKLMNMTPRDYRIQHTKQFAQKPTAKKAKRKKTDAE
jgi:AraC-like DNA-binding protein